MSLFPPNTPGRKSGNLLTYWYAAFPRSSLLAHSTSLASAFDPPYPLMSTNSYIFKTGWPTHISPSSPLIKSGWVNYNLFWEKIFRSIHFVLIPSHPFSCLILCPFASSALDHFAWSLISSSRFSTSHWIWISSYNFWLVLWAFLWVYLILTIWSTLFRLF